MVRILFTFEAGWLLHIHLYFDYTIQEITLDAYLIKFKIMMSSIDKQNMNWLKPSYESKSFIKI
jgi:hypothetical protein